MHSTERKSEIQVIEIKLYPRQIYVNLNSTPQNKFLKKSSNEQLNLAMLLLYVFRYSFILLYFWALFIYFGTLCSYFKGLNWEFVLFIKFLSSIVRFVNNFLLCSLSFMWGTWFPFFVNVKTSKFVW